MGATAKAYSSTLTMSGPVDIWFKCAVPTAGNAPTLHSDGTPESVANPNALHAGMLKSGGGIAVQTELVDRTSDNLVAPYDTRIQTANMSIKGDMLQFSATLLNMITVGSTVPGSPPSGKTGITLGSITSISYTCVLGIWEQKTSGKFFNAVIYNGYQANGLDLTLNRNEDSAAEVEFKAVAVGTRATADQIGALWIDS